MKCRLRFVTIEPLLKEKKKKRAGVKHFRFQERLQQKPPMKRGFFKDMKTEGSLLF